MTGDTTITTIGDIRTCVNTNAVATREILLADTFSCLATLSLNAGIATSSAVENVCLGVDTDIVAIGQARSAQNLALTTIGRTGLAVFVCIAHTIPAYATAR